MNGKVAKVTSTVVACALALSFAGLLWMVLYAFNTFSAALGRICLLLFGMLLQAAVLVAIRFFPQARFWPAACMLVSIPFLIFAGEVGPQMLYGLSYGFIHQALRSGEVFPLLYYLGLPGMICSLLISIAMGILAVIALVADVRTLQANATGSPLSAFAGRLPRIPSKKAPTPAATENTALPGASPAAAPAPQALSSEPTIAFDTTTPVDNQPQPFV